MVKPKDKEQACQKCNVIYELTCNECQHKYIGETGRVLSTRVKEHRNLKKSDNPSAVAEHMIATGHSFPDENIKVLTTEDSFWKRKIKEAIQIRRGRPELNRDQGYDLPAVYLQLLSCAAHDNKTVPR